MRTILSATLFLLAAGCGQKTSTDAASQAPVEDMHEKVLSQNSREAFMERLRRGADDVAKNSEQPDVSRPLAEYVPLNLDNGDAVLLYSAYSQAVPDYETALSVDGRLQGVTDVFQKQEAIDKAKPQLDEKIGSFKQSRYYILRNIGVKVGHYDLQTKSIPMVDFGGGQIAMSAASGKVRMVQYGGEKFGTFKPGSLDKAKEIESLVSTGMDTMPSEFYVFVKGVVAKDASYGSPEVVTQITRIRVLYPDGHPKQGQVIFEF